MGQKRSILTTWGDSSKIPQGRLVLSSEGSVFNAFLRRLSESGKVSSSFTIGGEGGCLAVLIRALFVFWDHGERTTGFNCMNLAVNLSLTRWDGGIDSRKKMG